MKRINLLAMFSVLFCVTNAFSEEKALCSSISRDLPYQAAIATASMFDNLRNKKGSLKYETNLMFAGAKEELVELKAPEGLCPQGCRIAERPYFIFSSVPRKFLKQYSDFDKCAALLAKTKKAPITYKNRSFSSLDEFNAWYNDFSQGKGTDGEDLYNRCDGACSPQYLTILQGLDKDLQVTAKVVCGHARDKDDNAYQIKSSFRWVCEDTP